MGVGLGTMAGVGGAVGGVVGNTVNGAIESAVQPVQAPTSQPADDIAVFKAKIEKLTMMEEAGLLSNEEFASLKSELLKGIL